MPWGIPETLEIPEIFEIPEIPGVLEIPEIPRISHRYLPKSENIGAKFVGQGGGLGPPGSCPLVVAIWPLGHLLVSAYIAQWSSFRLNRQAS